MLILYFSFIRRSQQIDEDDDNQLLEMYQRNSQVKTIRIHFRQSVETRQVRVKLFVLSGRSKSWQTRDIFLPVMDRYLLCLMARAIRFL